MISRIALICDGTNEIRAVDLMQRKQLADELRACAAHAAALPFVDA
jgi:hypothetical protein